MAFCYLHVVSHGLARVILPEPILDRSDPQGKEPGLPKAGRIFPAMYWEVMFKNTTDRYTVRIKVFIRNTWDWMEVKLRKSDKLRFG